MHLYIPFLRSATIEVKSRHEPSCRSGRGNDMMIWTNKAVHTYKSEKVDKPPPGSTSSKSMIPEMDICKGRTAVLKGCSKLNDSDVFDVICWECGRQDEKSETTVLAISLLTIIRGMSWKNLVSGPSVLVPIIKSFRTDTQYCFVLVDTEVSEEWWRCVFWRGYKCKTRKPLWLRKEPTTEISLFNN